MFKLIRDIAWSVDMPQYLAKKCVENESRIRVVSDTQFQRLFPKDPLAFKKIKESKLLISSLTSSDIQQSALGNCYFAATLGSIIDNEPSHLNDVIAWSDKAQKFIVSFYNQASNIKHSYAIEPTVVMEKDHRLLSSILSSARSYSAHKNPLLSMLEKAYALHRRLVTRTDRLEEEYNAKEISYAEALKGGRADEIYEAILGFSTNCIALQGQDPAIQTMQALYIYLGFIRAAYEEDPTRDHESIYNRLYSEYQSQLLTLFTEEELKAQSSFNIDTILKQYNKAKGVYGDLQKLFESSSPSDKKSELGDIVEKHKLLDNLTDEISKKVRGYLERNKDPAQKIRRRGDAIYTAEENGWFQRCREALDNHQMITLGTKKSHYKKQEKSSHGDELDYKGLYGPHEYQVMDVYQKASGVKYLLLRNPWACDVRTYTEDEDGRLRAGSATQVPHSFWQSHKNTPSQHRFFKQVQPLEKSGGVFELELSDLGKHGSNLYITNRPGSQSHLVKQVRVRS